MLPFTREKLYVNKQCIFYYDRNNKNENVAKFSATIHRDLMDYLGISREISLKEALSKAVTNQQKRYDFIKIHRTKMFYDNYLDQVIHFTQLLYYENFTSINRTRDENFYNDFENLTQTGTQLEKCFKQALKLCEDVKLMIHKQLDKEYPIETFADRNLPKK
ncbi:hypothetical protein ABPG74_003064 [Tetrahymena malaccensis]